jgi:hypothetical protein
MEKLRGSRQRRRSVKLGRKAEPCRDSQNAQAQKDRDLGKNRIFRRIRLSQNRRRRGMEGQRRKEEGMRKIGVRSENERAQTFRWARNGLTHYGLAGSGGGVGAPPAVGSPTLVPLVDGLSSHPTITVIAPAKTARRSNRRMLTPRRMLSICRW